MKLHNLTIELTPDCHVNFADDSRYGVAIKIVPDTGGHTETWLTITEAHRVAEQILKLARKAKV